MRLFFMVIIEVMEKENLFKELFWFVVKSLIIVVLLINFVFMPCIVNGSSMYPNYQEGEYGYSFIISRKLGISRFDTAVIRADASDKEKLLVKRVIGLPNETIEYVDNKLYVDGEYVEEPFLSDVTTKDFKVTLGQDEYYCLGDNRGISRDSRYYGPFKGDQIVSTHLLVIYPFSLFSFHK